jgi:hypothetical protein
MDLENMRSLGATAVDVYCCGHQASIDVSALPDDVPDVRMRTKYSP